MGINKIEKQMQRQQDPTTFEQFSQFCQSKNLIRDGGVAVMTTHKNQKQDSFIVDFDQKKLLAAYPELAKKEMASNQDEIPDNQSTESEMTSTRGGDGSF